MQNENSLKIIGQNIQLARLKKGYTQEILSEKCNISQKYISALETGRSQGSISLILKICKILDITPNYIFGKSIDIKNSNDSIEIIEPEILINYKKLKDENKEFIKNTINHLYTMQNRR